MGEQLAAFSFGSKLGQPITALNQPEHHKQEWQLIDGVFKLIKQNLSPMALLNTEKISNYHSPQDLREKFDFSLHETSNENWSSILDKCHQISDLSIKTGHRFFLQQLYHGVDPYGLAATLMIEALNTSIYTYDVGPVTTLIEMELIQHLADLIGFENGADGIFCPGGSMANMYGMNLARFSAEKKVKEIGLQGSFGGKRPMIFVSEQCHYSMTKGASFMGFGTDSIVMVKTNKSDGGMDVQDLQSQIQSHTNDRQFALMVVCTEGTTVLNAYDPLDRVADLCERQGIWLHADLCLGGAALFSNEHRKLLKGIERVDSLAWCWHKVLNAPFQTSLVICKHKGLLKECNSSDASYLYAKDKHYDTQFDTGDASLQCGRKADALKVWMMIKARGNQGIANLVNEAFKSADYFCAQIKSNNRFKLVVGKSLGTSVCFWVIPPSMVGKCDEKSEEFNTKMNETQQTIKARLITKGLGMIACQPLNCWDLPNFCRVTFGCHPLSSETDIDEFIELLLKLSEHL